MDDEDANDDEAHLELKSRFFLSGFVAVHHDFAINARVNDHSSDPPGDFEGATSQNDVVVIDGYAIV